MPKDDAAINHPILPSEKTVLVFGATGQQGGAVAAALRTSGWLVRALVRDPMGDKARSLKELGIDIVAGDFEDAATIRSAMAGVYGVFSVQPSSGQGPAYGVTDADEIRYATTIADIAAELGVGHFVYTSVATAGKGHTGMGHFDCKTQIEVHLQDLDMRSTIIRPSTFMELLMLPGMGLDEGAFTFLMRPDQAIQVVAVADIGKIAAAIFEDPERFSGKVLDIASDAITGEQLGDALCRAAGRPIVYSRFPDALLAENRFLGRLAELFDDGRLAGSADIAALRETFGELQTFENWLATRGAPLLRAALAQTEASLSLR